MSTLRTISSRPGSVLGAVVLVALLLAIPALAGCAWIFPTRTGGAPAAEGGANGAAVGGRDAQPAPDARAARPPSDSELMADWVHREGKRFASFTPDEDWQFVESQSGVDISSPIGDAVFSYAGAWGGPAAYSVDQVEKLVLAGMGISDMSVVSQTPVSGNAQGGRTRSTEFTGTRGGVPWHGVAKVDTLPPNGMAAQVAISVAEKWGRYSSTLGLIQRHTTALGADN